MIVDSNYEPQQVLIQNPDQPAPDEIMHSIGLMNVEYLGFDGKLHQGQITIAIEVMAEVEAFFRHALLEQHFPIERVIPVSAPEYQWNGKKVLKDNVSSGFDFRTIADTDNISKHGQGLAFDINPQQNPMLRYDQGKEVQIIPQDAVWSKELPGTLHADHPLVKLMEGFGWEWGGHWTPESGRTDYMHFQKNI